MKWSEEERKGEEKNKIEVRAEGFSGWSKHFTAWNQQPGCIGSHTCSSLFGHWVVLFSLGETPETQSALPAAPDGRSAPRATDGSAPKPLVETFLPVSLMSSSAAGPPSCRWRQTGGTRSQVLILIHLFPSQSNVTKSSRHQQQSVRLFCLSAQPNIWSSVCRWCFKFSRRNTKLIHAFNQLQKNR